jgi:hypothetical protein
MDEFEEEEGNVLRGGCVKKMINLSLKNEMPKSENIWALSENFVTQNSPQISFATPYFIIQS